MIPLLLSTTARRARLRRDAVRAAVTTLVACCHPQAVLLYGEYVPFVTDQPDEVVTRALDAISYDTLLRLLVVFSALDAATPSELALQHAVEGVCAYPVTVQRISAAEFRIAGTKPESFFYRAATVGMIMYREPPEGR